MLHIKNLDNVSELQGIFSNIENAQNLLTKFYKNFFVCKKVQDLNQIKTKGDSPVDILLVLLIVPFIHFGTISGLINSVYYNFFSSQKDVFYRFKNNSRIDWRSLLYSINKRFVKIVKDEKHKSGCIDSDEKALTYLIADDTLLKKIGKSIENVGMVFDHVSKKMVLGFKVLTLGFFDGKSFTPLDFSFHREKGKNKKKPFGLRRKDLKNQFKKQRDTSTPSAKRIKELDESKIDVLINMVKRAVDNGFIPDFLLVDSWFICEKLIVSIRKIKNGAIHIVGACRMDRRKYVLDGKEYSAKELLNKFKTTAKRCRSLNYKYIKLNVIYKDVELVLFFNRVFGQKKWHLIITTNTKLNFKKTMEIYSKRWIIEVFFKESKQHLNAGKCQSNNFDAQICDFTISCISYIMLSLFKRFDSYETIGGAFEGTKAFIIEQTVAERIWGMFLEILRELVKLLDIDVLELMQKITSDDEKGAKILKILNALNSTSKNDDFYEENQKNVA